MPSAVSYNNWHYFSLKSRQHRALTTGGNLGFKCTDRAGPKVYSDGGREVKKMSSQTTPLPNHTLPLSRFDTHPGRARLGKFETKLAGRNCSCSIPKMLRQSKRTVNSLVSSRSPACCSSSVRYSSRLLEFARKAIPIIVNPITFWK